MEYIRSASKLTSLLLRINSTIWILTWITIYFSCLWLVWYARRCYRFSLGITWILVSTCLGWINWIVWRWPCWRARSGHRSWTCARCLLICWSLAAWCRGWWLFIFSFSLVSFYNVLFRIIYRSSSCLRVCVVSIGSIWIVCRFIFCLVIVTFLDLWYILERIVSIWIRAI